MIRIRQHKVIAMTGMTTTTIIMFLITIIIIIHPKVRQFSKSVPLDFNTDNSSSSGNSDDDENDDHDDYNNSNKSTTYEREHQEQQVKEEEDNLVGGGSSSGTCIDITIANNASSTLPPSPTFSPQSVQPRRHRQVRRAGLVTQSFSGTTTNNHNNNNGIIIRNTQTWKPLSGSMMCDPTYPLGGDHDMGGENDDYDEDEEELLRKKDDNNPFKATSASTEKGMGIVGGLWGKITASFTSEGLNNDATTSSLLKPSSLSSNASLSKLSGGGGGATITSSSTEAAAISSTTTTDVRGGGGGASKIKELSPGTYFRKGKKRAAKCQFLQAVALYNLALMKQREQLGENHIDCGTTLNEIGVCWMMLGERYPALTAFEESLFIRQKHLGDGAMEVAEVTNNIWMILHEERCETEQQYDDDDDEG